MWLHFAPQRDSDSPVKVESYFSSVAALMSLQLREMVINSLEDLLAFFMIHKVCAARYMYGFLSYMGIIHLGVSTIRSCLKHQILYKYQGRCSHWCCVVRILGKFQQFKNFYSYSSLPCLIFSFYSLRMVMILKNHIEECSSLYLRYSQSNSV